MSVTSKVGATGCWALTVEGSSGSWKHASPVVPSSKLLLVAQLLASMGMCGVVKGTQGKAD